MPQRSDVWLFLAGAVASSVNAAAGGGTLLSFPSLLAAGLSPIAANATSTVGLLPGSFSSLVAYRQDLRKLHADALPLLVPSFVGGALGAWLLLALGGATFARVVPALLVGSSLLLLAQPLVARWLATKGGASRQQSPAAVFLASLAIAIYTGYFGAGAGILFLAAMGLLFQRPLSEVNTLKVLVATVSNTVGALTFVVLELRHPTGALELRAALPLALGAIAGGYGGVHLVRRLPPTALRAFAAAVGLAIAVYFLAR